MHSNGNKNLQWSCVYNTCFMAQAAALAYKHITKESKWHWQRVLVQGVEYLRPSLIFVSIYLILRADQTHRCDCSCAENQMCLKAQLNQDEGAQLLLARGLKVLIQ